MTIGDPHGLYRILVGLVDSSGYNYGTAGPGAAEGTMLLPYIVRYAQDAQIGIPDRTVIDFTGGDVWTGSYIYGITSLGTFQMTTSTIEAELFALMSNSQVDQATNSRLTYFSENIMESTPPQAWMMIIFRLQSKQIGAKGANKYMQIVLPRTWVSPKGVSGAPAFQAAGTAGYTMVPTVGDRFPWGMPFSSSTMNLAEDEGPVIYIISDYPLHTVGFIAEAAETSETINLPFKVSGVASITTPDSANDPLQTYIDGVVTDADSVNVTTGAVVVSPISPATEYAGGEYIGIVYETALQATS